MLPPFCAPTMKMVGSVPRGFSAPRSDREADPPLLVLLLLLPRLPVLMPLPLVLLLLLLLLLLSLLLLLLLLLALTSLNHEEFCNATAPTTNAVSTNHARRIIVRDEYQVAVVAAPEIFRVWWEQRFFW